MMPNAIQIADRQLMCTKIMLSAMLLHYELLPLQYELSSAPVGKLDKCKLHNENPAKYILLYGLLVWTAGLMVAVPANSAKNSDQAANGKSPAARETDADVLARARRSKQMFEDEEAIKAYTQYLTAHPDAEKIRAERAEEFRNEARFDECISDYRTLIKSKNFLIASNAATDLGKLYQKKGNYPEAIKAFKTARSLGVSTLLTELSDCARLSGDNETALQISNEIIKSGEIFAGRMHRANALLALKKPKLALDDSTYLVNMQRKLIAGIDKESRAIYTESKRLVEGLEVRAKCYEALKEQKLAQQDKAAITKLQQEIYNESPFLTKEKH